MNKLTNNEKVLILIVFFLSIYFVLIALGLTWNSEIGVADLINITLAIITFLAVRYSRIAAESSKESSKSAKESIEISKESIEIARESVTTSQKATEISERQTKIMINEQKRNSSPRLIPSNLSIVNNSNSILSHFDSDSRRVKVSGDIQLKIKNAGKGNAYYIQSWVQLENKEYFLNLKEKENQYLFSTFRPFKLTFERKENGKFDKLYVNEYESLVNPKLVRSQRINFFHNSPPYAYLSQNEEYTFLIASHIQVLLYDSLLGEINHAKGQKIEKYKFYLMSRYQNDNQLGTNLYTESKFDLLAYDIDVDFKRGRSIEFSISFSHLYTKEKENPKEK